MEMLELFVNRSDIKDIATKVIEGKRLSYEDGYRLFESSDLDLIGSLANIIRERKNGNKTYFVQNHHIDYTNICEIDCLFCSFRRDKEDVDAYVYTIEEMIKKIDEKGNLSITELHIVGGLHPELPYHYYIDLLKEIKQTHPQIHIKAFTCVEIDYIANLFDKDVKEVLSDFKKAGLGSLPGGGAEIFEENLRKRICADKISGNRWLEVAGIAHALGLPTNATMLYGHVEKVQARIEHLIALREQQDRSGGFMCFIPLAYHPENNRMGKLGWTMGIDDLKMIAVSRLMLDNFDHIKAYWISCGTSVAQIAQSFGADDIDGLVIEERIYQDAGRKGENMLTQSNLIQLIQDAGRDPVERGALYQIVKEY